MGEAVEQFWGNLADLGLLPDIKRMRNEEVRCPIRYS